MERAAFAKARSYLNFHLLAKWSALSAAVGTAVLYVGLLLVLGLFADLIITQGRIESFQNLSPHEQEKVRQKWQDAVTALELTVDDKTRAPLLRSELRRRLQELDIPPEFVELCVSSPTSLDARAHDTRLEILWRVQVHQLLNDHVGGEAAELYKQRFADQLQSVGVDIALTRDVPNLGVLSLVVRSRERFDGWVAGWLASWNPWMWREGLLWYLTGLLLAAIGVALVRVFLTVFCAYMATEAVITATTRLRRALYLQTYRLGTLAFRALGPSEAVGVSTRHLEAVHDGLYTWLTVVFREPVKFGLLVLFALLVNPWLALSFLLFALLVWLIGGQLAAFFRRQGRTAHREAADQLALLQESLMLMRLVKVYLMEPFNRARLERQLTKYGGAQRQRFRSEALYRPLLIFLGFLAAMLLVYVTGIVVLHGGQVGVTSTVVLAAALVSLYWPLMTWLEQRRILRRGRNSSRVLFNFLDRTGSVGQAVEAVHLDPLAKQLEFDNVTLKEPGTGRKLLQGISLTIRAGERVALVGPDDMEKHALVYLIPRFLDPDSGEIRIDKKNLRWVTLDSLRDKIAIVLQHNLVFNDSVANNIGCGDPSYPLPRIMEAAKVAHAHKFIQQLPQGYETAIGEMGHTLRIGERFRIALARAILRDPALLIIEEPLQPLDEETKALLDDTFARLLPGKTSLFLPHRLSTIRSCDRVYLLYEGRIEAAGDHRELLGQSELYRHLQYLEFNEFASLVNNQPTFSSIPEEL